MSDRALVTLDRAAVIKIAPASDAQLLTPNGDKPYWTPLVEVKPELLAGQQYGTPVYEIRADDVVRTWPVETTPLPQTDAQKMDALFTDDNFWKAFGKELAFRFGITPAALVAAIKARL